MGEIFGGMPGELQPMREVAAGRPEMKMGLAGLIMSSPVCNGGVSFPEPSFP